MNKEKVITYIKDVLAKNFTNGGIYSTRTDSTQIYNALMSINQNTEYSKMAALLNLIKKQAEINNKNLDDFINLLEQEALKENNAQPVLEAKTEEPQIKEQQNEEGQFEIKYANDIIPKEEPELIVNNTVKENKKVEEEDSESAKGNIMIFVISLLVLIIIILAVIIILFC